MGSAKANGPVLSVIGEASSPCSLASLVISILDAALLHVSRVQGRRCAKPTKALEETLVTISGTRGGCKPWYEKYAMFIIPSSPFSEKDLQVRSSLLESPFPFRLCCAPPARDRFDHWWLLSDGCSTSESTSAPASRLSSIFQGWSLVQASLEAF